LNWERFLINLAWKDLSFIVASQKTMEAVAEMNEEVLLERDLNFLLEITLRLEHELSMIIQSE